MINTHTPDMINDPLWSRIRQLEETVKALTEAVPLRRAAVTDSAGVVRLRTGYLNPDNDAAGFGLNVLNAGGSSVFRADEAGVTALVDSLTVAGGTIRALDVTHEASGVQDVSITGTLTTFVTHTHTKPSWANFAIAVGLNSGQMTNQTAGVHNVRFVCKVGGGASGGGEQSLAVSATVAGVAAQTGLLTSLGSTVTIEAQAQVNPSGTNTSNMITLRSFVIWLR